MAWSSRTLMRLADLVASGAIGSFPAVGRAVFSTVGAAPAGIEHLFTGTAAKLRLGSIAGSEVVAKLLLHARVIVSNPAAMLGIMLPVRNVGATVYIDLTATPVDPSTPIAPTPRPPPQRVGRAKGNSGRDDAGANVSWVWVVVIRRVVGIGPFTINDGRIVVGNIHGLRLGRLDRNELSILRLLDRNRLFVCRRQLFVVVGLGSQALNGIHDIRLLSEHSISQFLRPVEFGVHHR